MRERRLVPRQALRLEVQEINRRPATGAYLLDLSPLGFRLENIAPIPPTEILEVKFVLPGESRETRLVGEVIWLDERRCEDGRYHMGISLLRPHWKFMRPNPGCWC